MNKIFVVLLVLTIFSFGFSELYSPEVWFSFRRDTLVFSAGVSGDDVGEMVYYELIHKNPEAKSVTLFTKTIKPAPDETEWTLEFTGLKRDFVGKNALWIKETVGSGTDKSKLYGPYGFVKTKLIETADTAFSFEGDVRNFLLNAGEKYRFAHNKNGLIIALGNLENDLTISLDPTNSKTAFLAFANRIIIFRTEDKSVSFFYPERSIEKTAAILYKTRDWEGEMKIFDTANGKVIFIPWFDLGMKFESGRRFGFALHGDNFTYPVNADRYTPASWGNIILK
jgi:hypothetical protein